MARYLVFAGNHDIYKQWLHEKGLTERDAKYITQEHQIWGCRAPDWEAVFLYGWAENFAYRYPIMGRISDTLRANGLVL